MNRSEHSHAADGQADGVLHLHRQILAWWRGLDTDWQSVLVATALAALTVALDVPVPA